MQLKTLFTGRLVRLAAPRPDDHETFARWSENDQYLRIMDNDPARPRPEGAWREMIYRDGQRFDVLHYGLLRHEWQALHA